METLIMNLISKYGYFSIMVLIAIENVFPPIPSEVILCFAGFISKRAEMSLFLIILFATFGSLIGAIILYYIGSLFNEKSILKWCDMKGVRRLHIKKKNILKAMHEFKKNGAKSVFWGRFIPIIRSLISIPAGITHYDKKEFLLLTFLGSVMWNTILILLGNMVGENWYHIAHVIDKYTWLVFGIGIVIFLLIRHLRRIYKIEVVTGEELEIDE